MEVDGPGQPLSSDRDAYLREGSGRVLRGPQGFRRAPLPGRFSESGGRDTRTSLADNQ